MDIDAAGGVLRMAIDDNMAGFPDTGDAVWAICAELPPRQRAAVVLRFYEDLDYPEIAQLLGCSEATVRSHVHRALGALRSRLAEEDR